MPIDRLCVMVLLRLAQVDWMLILFTTSHPWLATSNDSLINKLCILELDSGQIVDFVEVSKIKGRGKYQVESIIQGALDNVFVSLLRDKYLWN